MSLKERIEKVVKRITHCTTDNCQGCSDITKEILLEIKKSLPEKKEEIDVTDCGTYETCRKEGFNNAIEEIEQEIKWNLIGSD